MKKPIYLFAILTLLVACKQTPAVEQLDNAYRNPVFSPVLADPTVVRADDGWFYAYGTNENWGDGSGTHLVAIVRSRNLTQWKYVRDAFITKPTWKDKGGIWAPDVAKVNGKYHLYYALSTWGDPNPGIGLAVADSAAGPFIDLGKILLSQEVDVPNSIDPFYLEADGKKFLFWGSFSNSATQGNYGVELAADGRSVPNLSKKFKVAAGDIEGVMIQKHGEYYYFFGSKGSCCDGANSTYNVRVARSKNLRGPYLDKTDKDLKERGAGTLILRGDDIYAGPGHIARLVTDDAGTDWMLYHAIIKSNPKVPSGANRRVLMLDKVNWVNGWPTIANATPSGEKTPGPVFR